MPEAEQTAGTKVARTQTAELAEATATVYAFSNEQFLLTIRTAGTQWQIHLTGADVVALAVMCDNISEIPF